MEINLKNFEIRRSMPFIAGPEGLGHDEERYIAKASGLVGLDVFRGDNIIVKNIEGMQECEMSAFDKKGKNNLGVIGEKENAQAKYIKKILSESSNNNILSKLKNKNINFHNAASLNFFDEKSFAGETKEMIVHEDGYLIIASPGKDMKIDEQTASSDLEIKIKRKDKKNNKLENYLPDPLADTKNEYLIKNS